MTDQSQSDDTNTGQSASDTKSSNRWPQRLLNILIIAALATAGYGAWLGWQLFHEQKQRLFAIEQNQTNQVQVLNREASALKATNEAQAKQLRELQTRSKAQSLRIDSQDKRLLSISTTTKEDWKLLEARYLLRIANQKLMTERDSEAAIIQLSAADDILAELGQVDLLPIREAIVRDISTLKLAPMLDRSGTYFRLQGIIANIKQLPAIAPLKADPIKQSQTSDAPVLIEKETMGYGSAFSDQVLKLWHSVITTLEGYIRIRHHDKPIQILSPDTQVYVNHSLRLQIEQAQLALMSEEQSIYTASLVQAIGQLQEYFQLNDQVNRFIDELTELSELQIKRPLPSVSGSLAQLDSYIERLHKLQQVKKIQPKADEVAPKTPEGQAIGGDA